MYATRNFKTKKALKEAVRDYNVIAALESPPTDVLKIAEVTYFQPGPFGGKELQTGTFCVEGPHYPEPHKWYATCKAVDGRIVSVK